MISFLRPLLCCSLVYNKHFTVKIKRGPSEGNAGQFLSTITWPTRMQLKQQSLEQCGQRRASLSFSMQMKQRNTSAMLCKEKESCRTPHRGQVNRDKSQTSRACCTQIKRKTKLFVQFKCSTVVCCRHTHLNTLFVHFSQVGVVGLSDLKQVF